MKGRIDLDLEMLGAEREQDLRLLCRKHGLSIPGTRDQELEALHPTSPACGSRINSERSPDGG